jgi:hypothetical protein
VIELSNGGDVDAISGTWRDELWLPLTPPGPYHETGDGAHVYWFEPMADGRFRFVWDGRSGEDFDDFFPQHDGGLLAHSAGDLHVAYYGQGADRFFVGIDGSESRAFEGITRSVPPTFSPDGRRLAFGVYVDGVARLVLDGELYGDWRPAPKRPLFSPDGSRFAFVAENLELNPRQSQKGYRQWVVLDGVPQPDAEGIADALGTLQFSPDGRQFIYAAIEKRGVRLVVDGVPRAAVHRFIFPDVQRRRPAVGVCRQARERNGGHRGWQGRANVRPDRPAGLQS